MTSSASPSADIVIVGGAVMGSSAAYHLLADSGFKGRVIVIEKDPTYQLSASALSAASIRQQYSSAVNIRISLYGIDFLRSIGDRLAVEGERPEIGLREGGYLYCASEAGAPILAENHALQTAEGADILYMDPAALKDRFRWLNVEDLAAGTWGRSGEGWFDGWGLLQAFRKKARSLGAEYCAGSGGRVVAAMAGLEIPVRAKRRYVFTFSCKGPVENCPLLIDTSGAYVRPEGEGHFICGASPEADVDPDWFDEDPASQEIDHAFFEEFIWPSLAHRVPAFEAIKPGRAWSGPYDMSLLDHTAIIGQALQQAPAVGRGLAELIVHGGYRTLDLSELGYERVLANRPLLERNVI
jgi:glycine/D-amino acid oxidase-like deaminating enzyme